MLITFCLSSSDSFLYIGPAFSSSFDSSLFDSITYGSLAGSSSDFASDIIGSSLGFITGSIESELVSESLCVSSLDLSFDIIGSSFTLVSTDSELISELLSSLDEEVIVASFLDSSKAASISFINLSRSSLSLSGVTFSSFLVATGSARAGFIAVPKNRPITKILDIIISVFFLIIFSLFLIYSSP